MSKDISESPLDFIPTADQFSWVGSILPIGGLVGPIIFSPLPARIGRKNCLILTALILILSFLILMFTDNLPSIYIARFLQGIGSGLVMVFLPMYIGEISSPECRGILSSFIQIGLVGKLRNILF
jgi:MFS family permease